MRFYELLVSELPKLLRLVNCCAVHDFARFQNPLFRFKRIDAILQSALGFSVFIYLFGCLIERCLELLLNMLGWKMCVNLIWQSAISMMLQLLEKYLLDRVRELDRLWGMVFVKMPNSVLEDAFDEEK